MKPEMEPSRILQTIWGIALVLMAAAVCFRIPLVMERVKRIDYFSSVLPLVRISFYLMAILLAGGGIKKLYGIWWPQISERGQSGSGKD